MASLQETHLSNPTIPWPPGYEASPRGLCGDSQKSDHEAYEKMDTKAGFVRCRTAWDSTSGDQQATNRRLYYSRRGVRLQLLGVALGEGRRAAMR